MKGKVQKNSTETLSKKRTFLKRNAIDLISISVAIISLITTIYIGFQANEIAKRTQPLEYSVVADRQIDVFEYDTKMHTTGGIVFKQINSVQSGEFSSIFLTTVQDDMVDIVYIPHEKEARFEFAYESNKGLSFYMSDENANKLLFSPSDMTVLENTNNKLQMFHLIFKGHNREYTIYSVVYTLDGEIAPEKITVNGTDQVVPIGKLNCYVLNEDNMYEPQVYQQIAEDLNKGNNEDSKYTSKQLLEAIEKERRLSNEKIKSSH